MIHLSGVKRSFREGAREHVVFDDLHLDVATGETVVVLGRSGSGKSTLLNLISGIDYPDAGRIEVGGVDITSLGERERTLFRRRRVGFIFQFFNLIPTLTVLENILLPLELNGVLDDPGRERASRLLLDAGLGGREGSYPDRLSGGEQQRVAVARALVHEPDVVLADEPTGNLDRETGLGVLRLLDEQVRDTGRTMVMATHSREVVGVADRIVGVTAGRVRSLGSGEAP
jgi:putative ABC transport system ATP-binding protein